jgi:hypothetical protein
MGMRSAADVYPTLGRPQAIFASARRRRGVRSLVTQCIALEPTTILPTLVAPQPRIRNPQMDSLKRTVNFLVCPDRWCPDDFKPQFCLIRRRDVI